MSGSFRPLETEEYQRVVFLEAFGHLSHRVARDKRSTGEEDLDSVFTARAELMGWSMTLGGSSGALRGQPRALVPLWQMHEAELTANTNGSRLGWVQVGLEAGVEIAAALSAMAQCFDDALNRFGVVELAGLQVTCWNLPPAGASAASNLAAGLNWFNTTGGPRSRALVALDDGVPGQERDGPGWIADLNGIGGRSFAFGRSVLVPHERAIEVPTEMPYVELAPARWGLQVTLPEWKAPATAWVLAAVIDAFRHATPDLADFAVRLSKD